MRWAAIALGALFAMAALAWALVSTGHWPLDDRKQPAAVLYALNGALGRWLVDHGEPGAAAPGIDLRARGGTAGDQPGAPPLGGLTAEEQARVRQTLWTDPRLRSRHPFTPVPTSSGRG